MLWFWYILVLIANILSFFLWFIRCLPFKANIWIKRRIALFNEDVKKNKAKNRLNHFINEYLEADGIFMVRIIGNNSIN